MAENNRRRIPNRNNNQRRRKARYNKLAIGITAAIAVVVIGSIFTVNYIENKREQELIALNNQREQELNTGKIYPNIIVDGVNVGNLTKEEAVAKLQENVGTPYSKNTIRYVNGKENYDLTYEQLGIKYNPESAVETAYNYAREGETEEKYNLYLKLKNNEEKQEFNSDPFAQDAKLNDEEKQSIKTAIEKNIKDKVYIPVKNASLKRENGSFIPVSGENGKELDVDKTVDLTVQTIENNKDARGKVPVAEIDLPMNEIQPTVTTEQVSQVKDLIGKYSTKYSGGGGRVTNMKVATSRLNGSIIYPGETFSTNKCFGESTPANGYELAGAYINGKLDQDYGGGVCQVSSTLYNAVLRAELKVAERANHSLTVGYVPRGFDATLAGDYIDFKFTNDTSVPVYIESYLTGNQVVVNLYGKEIHSAGRTLEFKSEFKNGSYKTYKEVYENGKFVEEVYLARSTYKNIKSDTNGNPKVVVESTTATTTAEPATETTTQAPKQNSSSSATASTENKKTETTTAKPKTTTTTEKPKTEQNTSASTSSKTNSNVIDEIVVE